MNKEELKQLESESIYVLREAVGQFKNPVLLYSVGKDSSVLLHLARKAFYPAKIPFPILHIDTAYKFTEMYEFRDSFIKKIGANLIVARNEIAISKKTSPKTHGLEACCNLLKTQTLLAALRENSFDAAIGGARRDEEKSRAKEKFFSFRNSLSQWDPEIQRPELWSIYNGKVKSNESIRVFPLSNWTELDIWHYIKDEKIPILSLYFAKERKVYFKNNTLILNNHTLDEENVEVMNVRCRFRTLGCISCTGAVRSDADTIDKIIEEIKNVNFSERNNRLIDSNLKNSMEEKKRTGYF